MPIVLKSGNLSVLEPSGPVQACHGIALYFAAVDELKDSHLSVMGKNALITIYCGMEFMNFLFMCIE